MKNGNSESGCDVSPLGERTKKAGRFLGSDIYSPLERAPTIFLGPKEEEPKRRRLLTVEAKVAGTQRLIGWFVEDLREIVLEIWFGVFRGAPSANPPAQMGCLRATRNAGVHACGINLGCTHLVRHHGQRSRFQSSIG